MQRGSLEGKSQATHAQNRHLGTEHGWSKEQEEQGATQPVRTHTQKVRWEGKQYTCGDQNKAYRQLQLRLMDCHDGYRGRGKMVSAGEPSQSETHTQPRRCKLFLTVTGKP